LAWRKGVRHIKVVYSEVASHRRGAARRALPALPSSPNARDRLGKGASSRAPTIGGACGNASAHRYRQQKDLVLSPESFVLPRDLSGVKMLFVAMLVLLALTGGAGPAQPARAAGAVGIIVRHGDGRLLYAYIPLTSDGITGAEALQKAGFTLNVSIGGSFGVAVCTIDGEGCVAPREDCFCKSYGDPSFYWHYYLHNPDGSWRTASLGAGNRVLHAGDVDGWSWTSGDNNLPAVTLEQIAAAVQAPNATPTAVPLPTATTVVASVATATADTQPRAAVIASNGSATPITTAEKKPSNAPGGRAIGGFIAVAAVMLGLLALVPLGARRAKRRRDAGTEK